MHCIFNSDLNLCAWLLITVYCYVYVYLYPNCFVDFRLRVSDYPLYTRARNEQDIFESG